MTGKDYTRIAEIINKELSSLQFDNRSAPSVVDVFITRLFDYFEEQSSVLDDIDRMHFVQAAGGFGPMGVPA